MCGIFGIIAPNLEGIQPRAGLNSLHHRGPDFGADLSESSGSQTVYLGHRRLSIIDLSDAGNQPMTAEHATIIYNGEVYNFEELRKTYLNDVAFKSRTDTEVILQLYLKFGPDFIQKLNGDFSLAIFDRRRKKIFLYRDKMGVKPFYLYQKKGVFAFSSEIKAFRAAGLPLSLNEKGVGKYLVFKYSPGQETLFTEVERLKPAEKLIFDLENSTVRREKYWELPAEIKAFKGSYADAKMELRHLFEKAVNDRLIGDVPIANYLSGGLDSSLIAYYLKSGNHAHYCAVKNEGDLKAEGTTSDGHYAALLAKEWNLDLREIPIGIENLTPEHLREAVTACDDLIADGSIIPAMLIAKAAAKDHRVVLSGMGADELFLGYNGHFLTRLNAMAAKVPGLKPAAGSAMRSISAGRGPFKAYRRYLQKWGNNLGKPFEASRFSLVGDVDSAVSVFNGDAGFEAFVAPYFSKEQNLFDSLFEFEMENFLVKNLHYLDRSSMAYGLESRVPYLDTELVTFAAGLPLDFKMSRSLKSKKILKEAYRAELPDYVTRRRKAGFGMPLRSLLSDPRVLDTFLPRDYFGDQPFFDADQIQKLISAHQSGKQDQSALIYALISFRFWAERWL